VQWGAVGLDVRSNFTICRCQGQGGRCILLNPEEPLLQWHQATRNMVALLGRLQFCHSTLTGDSGVATPEANRATNSSGASAAWRKDICVAGLLDTITSTADSKDCPGVCVHTLATLICYEVLEDVVCPSPSMRCCIEPPPSNSSLPPPKGEAQSTMTSVSSTGQPTRRPPQVRTLIYLLHLFVCGLFSKRLKVSEWNGRKIMTGKVVERGHGLSWEIDTEENYIKSQRW
jgi:hypothetical protein